MINCIFKWFLIPAGFFPDPLGNLTCAASPASQNFELGVTKSMQTLSSRLSITAWTLNLLPLLTSVVSRIDHCRATLVCGSGKTRVAFGYASQSCPGWARTRSSGRRWTPASSRLASCGHTSQGSRTGPTSTSACSFLRSASATSASIGSGCSALSPGSSALASTSTSQVRTTPASVTLPLTRGSSPRTGQARRPPATSSGPVARGFCFFCSPATGGGVPASWDRQPSFTRSIWLKH